MHFNRNKDKQMITLLGRVCFTCLMPSLGWAELWLLCEDTGEKLIGVPSSQYIFVWSKAPTT